jgi:hypothetical protein
MTDQDLTKPFDTVKYEEILIVYSENLKCYEQHTLFGDIRTFVLVCTKDDGYVAVAAKMEDWGYLTLKRWVVEYPGGFSFSIPATEKFRLKCVPAEILLSHYASMFELWDTIDKHTRSHVVLPLPPGNTG